MYCNNLIVIENRRLCAYTLDDRTEWKIGRPSKGVSPDIRLYSATVSRQHGRLKNQDGFWFYLDGGGINGTVLNGKFLETRCKENDPHPLSNGDVFIFGGGRKPDISQEIAYAVYLERFYGNRWTTVDTGEASLLDMKFGGIKKVLKSPDKGQVIEEGDGIVIYMGDFTYMIGDVALTFR